MRDSVRRLCSLLTASKPSPIAISGTRKPSIATKDGKRIARDREQPQQQERILGRVLAETVDRAIERGQRRQHDQQFQHQHADAGDIVGQLLDKDGAKPLERRTFTPHDAPPLRLAWKVRA